MDNQAHIYLDFNSTTPLNKEVYSIICSSLKNSWGNPSSDSYFGEKPKENITAARKDIAFMLNGNPKNVIFTSGGTEGNNMIIKSVLKIFKQSNNIKPHIITSSIEHDATLKLLDYLEEKGSVEVTKISPEKNGQFIWNAVSATIRRNTCLVTLMMANNETGVIFPIAHIGRKLKEINREREQSGINKIYFHIDAAQTIGKVPVNFTDLNVDYITVVGHKFYGPRIGAVCKLDSAPLVPLLFGGGQEFGLRPGTENTAMICGLGKACQIVTENLKEFSDHMMHLRNYLESKLKEKFGKDVLINFEACPRLPNTTSASFSKVNGKELLHMCPQVAASTGSACHSASENLSRVLLEVVPVEVARGTVRFSTGRETTEQEIDQAIHLLYIAFKQLIDLTK